MAEGGFWKTAPGVITAVAAIITAIGGFIAVLFQIGVIGSAQKAVAPSSPVVAASTTTAGATGAPGGKAWRDVEATITDRNGKQTRTRAEAVRFCISTGAGINLDDSQDIAFEKMSAIEVLGSAAALSPGGRATLRVTLTSGATLEGTITSGCDFFAETEVGRYSLYPDQLRKIEFHR